MPDLYLKILAITLITSVATMHPQLVEAQITDLSQPSNLVIELLEETPAPALPAPTYLSSRQQIALPLDTQPPTPNLPDIGEFIDMPGTNGEVEFTRITGPSSGGGARTHSYSRRSAIDPFNKYVLLNGYLYHLKDFTEFKQIPLGYEYVPSFTKEDEFFGLVGNKLQRWNAVTGQITDIWSAPTSSQLTIGRWEGQQSWDDRYIVLAWNDGSHQLAVVDMTTGESTGQINASSIEGDFNWADVSPRGTYVVVGTNAGVFRYNIDFTNKTRLNTNQYGNAHSDLMLDKEGNEVFVQEGHFNNGDISYNIMETNTLHQMDLVITETQNALTFPSTASHISGQATDVPGRVLISLNYQTGMSSIFAADLVPGQSKIYNWGHSHSTGDSYYSEAHATISSDSRSVIWTSNWMSSGGGNYEFLARVKQ